ncbi:ATP synthase F0F1 subunit A [Microbacterium mangrovi]|uniref:ATP synthase subunit a n=1 Tax=Microbacterium mangrovi TaxID=1348253 RepID=A0A0B2A7F5_9MICO|nr:ATP synthase F0F1 subunit A [Microbacterium mangrovi]
MIANAATDDSGFHGPSIDDFFPPALLFEGTPFELNRIMVIRLLVVVVLILLMWLATRNMKIVPGRGQAAFEFLFMFVRKGVIFDNLGEERGRRYEPIIMTFFFTILGMNLVGSIPGLQIAGTAAIGLPVVMAIIAWVMFIYAGFKEKGFRFLKDSLFLPGVPWPLYFLLTPLEFLSTFIVRPVTLALRLTMNMVSGHMLVVLCFSATQFFFFTVLANGNLLGLLGFGSFAFGVAFTVLDLFVAALQAYVFAILSAIYIQLSVAEEH